MIVYSAIVTFAFLYFKQLFFAKGTKKAISGHRREWLTTNRLYLFGAVYFFLLVSNIYFSGESEILKVKMTHGRFIYAPKFNGSAVLQYDEPDYKLVRAFYIVRFGEPGSIDVNQSIYDGLKNYGLSLEIVVKQGLLNLPFSVEYQVK